MPSKPLVFYAFAAVLLASRRSRVITARNPVHAALFLVLAFFTAAALWLLLQRRVPRHRAGAGLRRRGDGAVPVRGDDARHQPRRLREGFWQLPAARRCVVAVLMVLEMGVVLLSSYGAASTAAAPAAAGRLQQHQGARRACSTPTMCSPFEIAAVILLVAIVAAIALTLRRRKDTKYQDPATQIAVQRKDRVRLVNDGVRSDRDRAARRRASGTAVSTHRSALSITWCWARSCSPSAWSASSSTARTSSSC